MRYVEWYTGILPAGPDSCSAFASRPGVSSRFILLSSSDSIDIDFVVGFSAMGKVLWYAVLSGYCNGMSLEVFTRGTVKISRNNDVILQERRLYSVE